MIEQHMLDVLPAIAAHVRPGAQDRFWVCDTEGFCQLGAEVPCETRSTSTGFWRGEATYNATLKGIREGDLDCVALSEQYLEQFEDLHFDTRAWRTVDDVVGAIPNVPAMLSGNPYHMRQRRRVARETAPLTLFVDTTSSAAVKPRVLRRRGGCLLALVRLLASVRPVELHVVISGSSAARDNLSVVCKIDTTPLDLARAAFILTDELVARGVGYSILRHKGGHNGNWAYSNATLVNQHGGEIYGRLVPGNDVAHVPGAYLKHPSVHQPEQWLRQMLVTYAGFETEEAA